ncbi:hypothetical protein C0J52_03721 [Blattella germanica]|nr:hypothetical protein C0J52_03721 [Blattella germanica]
MLPIMCDETLDVEYDDSLDSSNEVRTELNNPPITSVNQFGGVSNNIDTSRTLSEEAEEEIKNLDPKYTYTGANNVSSNAAKDRNGSASGSEDDEDYVYEYDIDLSHSSYNWAELVPTLIVYGATMVVGIAGNSLIIFTICRYRRMKSTTNVFLASLASADLLLIIICIPVKCDLVLSVLAYLGLVTECVGRAGERKQRKE